MSNIGIDGISYYVPQIFLDMRNLAEVRNIPFAKLNKGLGLNKMAVPDKGEDAATFAANALRSLIDQHNIDPRTIGRIYLGTESAVDGSKPTATYAIQVVEEELIQKFGSRCFKNCDVLDMTFACVGAVDALHNSIDWVRCDPNRKAIVIASDIAKYEINSPGEYTQGAGAVALLITHDPGILAISDTWGVATKSEGDFFKPRRSYEKSKILRETAEMLGVEICEEKTKELLNKNSSEFWSPSNSYFELFKEEPVFDGPLSNDCYKERIFEAIEHFQSQKELNVLKDWQHLIFHQPYAYQGRRMIVPKWIEWLKENNMMAELTDEVGKPSGASDIEWIKSVSKSSMYSLFVKERVADGEKASSEIGNMYTASIFMSLLSLLYSAVQSEKVITGNKVGFLSYGSGSKSKVFEGTIQKEWINRIASTNLFEHLESRTAIDIRTYNQLHTNNIKHPVSTQNSVRLQHISDFENSQGLRMYQIE